MSPKNKSYSPGPGRYEPPPLLKNTPYREKNKKKGKFGIGYERFKLVNPICYTYRLEILIKGSRSLIIGISQARIRTRRVINLLQGSIHSILWAESCQEGYSLWRSIQPYQVRSITRSRPTQCCRLDTRRSDLGKSAKFSRIIPDRI